MTDALMKWKFGHLPREYLDSERFALDLEEDVSHRVNRFHNCLVPWIRRAASISNFRVIEVGSGGGAATAALAPYVKHIHCYEIEENPKKVARARLDFWGHDNVTFEQGLFSRDAALLQTQKNFDAVFLIAVLEHTHFHEFREILLAAYDAVKPGGLIVVAETPNRLHFKDAHTSFLPFFQWLPPEIAREYYSRSPREHFVQHIGDSVRKHGANSSQVTENFARWGRGVSYHDFEIVLGERVHDQIVLDGWEEEIVPLLPSPEDDKIILSWFSHLNVKASRAFALSWMYFVIKKPTEPF